MKHASSVVLSTGILALLSPCVASAAILDSFTFGTVPPSLLTPTSTAGNLFSTAIKGEAGITLDLNSNQVPVPASSPWLRVSPTGAWSTPALAQTNNADFMFTLTAAPNAVLNLTSLDFDALKGGDSLRGWAVATSVDNFTSIIASSDLTNNRTAGFRPFSVSLSGAQYQNLGAITFKIYSYAPLSGNSVEYDNIMVNGTTAFTVPVYIWTGATNGTWDTATANWSSTGTVYVDNTASSNAVFDDTATGSGSVAVAAGGVTPNSVAFSNSAAKAYTLSGGSVNVATNLTKSGNGTLTINNAVSAGTVTIGNGSVTVSGGGSLTSPSLNVTAPGNVGTLTVASDGSLGATTGLVVSSAVNFNNASQTVATLGDGGATTGVVTLNGTALTVTGTSSYGGKISGTGSIVKSTNGALTLTNNTNNFSGGITINGGAVQLSAVSAAGTGGITVNSGGALGIGANITNAVTLAGGTIGSTATNATFSSALNVTADSVVKTYNPITNATGTDLILTGMLQGSGSLTVNTLNGNNPDSAAFRLRGPASTNFTGNLILPQSAKAEIQTGASSGSVLGTGTIMMAGGLFGANASGTFSILNVRNNNTAGSTTFGNNVQIQGFGTAIFNMLGSAAAGSTTTFGDLQIGSGQSLVAAATAGSTFTLAFNSVHLQGGEATFVPRPVGNANYIITQNISLNNVTESVAGSGVVVSGVGAVTLTGTSNYSGFTSVQNGMLAVNGTLNGTPAVFVNNGTLTGGGTINAPVSIGDNVGISGSALLNAGGIAATGTLSTKDLSLAFADAGLQLEINTSTLVSDTIAVTGTLTLGEGLATLLATDLGAVTLSHSEVFTIATATGGVTGFFSGFTEGSTVNIGTNPMTISYQNNAITLTAVPEPGSALALLGGLASMAGLRRFRRRS